MPTRSRSKYFAVVLDFSAPFTTVSAKSKHSHVKLGTETAVIFVTVSTLSLYKLNPRLVKPEVLLSVVSRGYCGLLFINTVPSREAFSESLYGMATVTPDSQSVRVVCSRPRLRITTRV